MFFILGRPRSGTTLLTTLFNAHPNVRIAPEFPIFLPLYQKFRKVKDWDEATIRSFVDHLYDKHKFNNRTLENLKIDREQYTADILEMQHKGNIQDFLKSINYHSFSLYEKKNTLLIGDKNPLYSIYAKRFLKIFPEAKFICIIRDYRDNFVSMKKLEELKLEAPILTLQVYRWRYVLKLFIACRKKYPGRFLIMKYEDLVTEQEKVFKELCEFTGIPFDPVVFDFYKKKEETMKAYNNPLVGKFHGNLMKPINTGRMNLYKKDLTEKQIRMADQVAGKYGDLLNYKKEYPGFNTGLWIKSRPLAIYGWIIFKLMVAASCMPYKMSLWFSLKSLILVKTYSRFFGEKALPGKNN